MGTRKTRGVPARLEELRRRLEGWRGTHRVRSRIPEGLWAAAVKAAARYGLHRTARALRLEYYSLKKRVEQHASIAVDPPRKAVARRRRNLGVTARPEPTFLELAPVADRCECTLELEDAAGAKMRVSLKGAAMPDLVALGRSFWNPAP